MSSSAKKEEGNSDKKKKAAKAVFLETTAPVTATTATANVARRVSVKRLGSCSIYELEEYMRNERKKSEEMLVDIDTEKRLCDFSHYEVEEHIRRKKEIEAAEPKKCRLPMIDPEIFRSDIMPFLETPDKIVLMEKGGLVSRLFSLPEYFCSAHGLKLEDQVEKADEKLPPASTESAACSKRKRDDEDAGGQTLTESIPRIGPDFEEWKTFNPSLNPTNCRLCLRAERGQEFCERCGVIHKWEAFFTCVNCEVRFCDREETKVLCDHFCGKFACGNCGGTCSDCGEGFCGRSKECVGLDECEWCESRICDLQTDCGQDHLDRHWTSFEY